MNCSNIQIRWMNYTDYAVYLIKNIQMVCLNILIINYTLLIALGESYKQWDVKVQFKAKVNYLRG